MTPPQVKSMVSRAIILFTAAILAMWICTSPGRKFNRRKKKRGIANDRFSAEKVPKDLDTIVIGSGMGGLSCAAMLARMGKRVLVLEQHTVAGGSTHSFEFKGYKFDSGLHYTVPWSGPLFQLTCLKTPENVPQFRLLGEPDGTFDKIYLGSAKGGFHVKHGEKHLASLYAMFPKEKQAIDAFLRVSADAMAAVKIFAFSKLLPLWLQPLYWWLVPTRYKVATRSTAKDILSGLTKNKQLVSLLCGLWIDTGARPDTASFMLSGAVFRGLPLEGGCYPDGGPDGMAEVLIPTIESRGGRVLVRARVQRVLVDADGRSQRAVGVELTDGTKIHAKSVVSAAGYLNTVNNMVDTKTAEKAGLVRKLPNVRMSSGFVMANIGINKSAEELKISSSNIWYHPATAGSKDIFEPLEAYYKDPLGSDAPAMITFPSIKSGDTKSKVSCQVLLIAEWEWFSKYAHLTEAQRAKNQQYQALKKRWLDRALNVVYKFFPQVKGHVDFTDLSTPLTIKHYLEAPSGGAVGLDQTPARYGDWDVQKHLDVSTPIEGLFMTGQDQLVCGVVLAQLCGVITAFRMTGLLPSMRAVLQSVFLL